jgi:hypothetical protein
MTQVFIRPLPQASTPFAVEVDDGATVADLQAIVASQASLQPDTVRFIFHSKVLDKSTLLSTVTSTAASPIVFYGKKAAQPPSDSPPIPQPQPLSEPLPSPPSQPPAPPPLRPAPTPSPNVPTLAGALAVEELKLAGFDEREAIHALSLAHNDTNFAAEILLTGHGRVTPEIEEQLRTQAVRTPNPQTAGLLIYQITSNQHTIQTLFNTGEIIITTPGGRRILVLRTEVDRWMSTMFEMDLATFLRTGGWQLPERMAKFNMLIVENVQSQLNLAWTDKYARCTPDEKEKVKQLMQEGLTPASAMQLFFACRKDIAQALMAWRHR